MSHLERMAREKIELDERKERLARFIGGEVFRALGHLEQSRLTRQLAAMGLYSNILGERIADAPPASSVLKRELNAYTEGLSASLKQARLYCDQATPDTAGHDYQAGKRDAFKEALEGMLKALARINNSGGF